MRFILLICFLQFSILNILFSQTININSITWSRQSSGDNGYTLDGNRMTGSRAKLLAPANFSASGIYPKSISIYDAYGLSGDLTQISSVPTSNIFFFGSFIINVPSTQQFTSAEIDSVYNWSKKGGKLIIATSPNGAGYDLSILNNKWGFHDSLKAPSYLSPTTDGNNTDIFNGPFGNVSYASQGGYLQGYFDVIPANSKVFATDPNTGNPTLFMDCNTLDLIAADVDVYTDLSGISSGGAINNMQDIFWANAIVFMDKLQPLPIISNTSNTLSLNSAYNDYQWYLNGNPISNSNSLSVTENGTYNVEVTVNGGCKVFSNSIVVDNFCEGALYLPNAFSPNNDGENDILKIYYNNINCIKKNSLTIYDRFGEKVFETTDANFKWNGEYNGKMLNTQVLVYSLHVEFTDKTLLDKKGNISLTH
ncbi:MAG: gliding motility-associated C-terminal domain-containing protein [Bacteroidetes bacterium]|nr:gliding motility-associated C-terminal domain-containing protein [Bacteroidota bacterium]